MKRFHLLLISCLFAATSFAQGYSEQQLASIMDSVSTNPNYVIRWADGAIAQNAKCADAYFIKAFVFVAQEDYLKALELLNKSLSLVSKKSVINKSYILCTRGAIYQKVEDYDLALADYTQAISINPKETDAYEYRINIYKKNNAYDKAEADCRILLTIKDSLEYTLELASLLTYQEKTDEALDILNKIVIEDQTNDEYDYAIKRKYNIR